MSTLPRPTGKELVRALERAGFVIERTREATTFCGIPTVARPSSHFAPVRWAWVYYARS